MNIRSTTALNNSIDSCGSLASGLYMWTFTFRAVLDISTARKRWSQAAAELVRHASFYGVRVFELHPNGHGLHIHMVTGSRFPVRLVRHLCRPFGFGRIHVTKVNKNPYYIGKYLAKAERPGCFAGVRLWAAVGRKEPSKKGWASRCKDIRINGLTVRSYKVARDRHPEIKGMAAVRLGAEYELAALEHGEGIEREMAIASNWAQIQRTLPKQWKPADGISAGVRVWDKKRQSDPNLRGSDAASDPAPTRITLSIMKHFCNRSNVAVQWNRFPLRRATETIKHDKYAGVPF